MPRQAKIVTYDVDPDSLASLRQAFPGWHIETKDGSSVASLARDWNPGEAELLIVGARERVAETLGLCRGIRSQSGRARATILVLVSAAQGALVRAALEAGADSCLVLPIHPKELVSAVARARAGNQPGRHTLGLDQAQLEDQWRDDGGES